MILLLVSFENNNDAEKTANYLIDNHLAACVEIYPVKNFYVWDNKKIATQEISGIIKTSDENFEKVKTVLEEVLPYDIPQIIKLDANANESYDKWVKESTK